MEINNKFKRIGIASLIAVGTSLSTVSLNAAAPNDGSALTIDQLGSSFQNSFMNITPGENFIMNEGELDEKHILTTTSLYYRFGPAFESYEPIFHISPLSISMGCGGFSIKGMFMSILGIDRIQEMLKSSATSFAYGIVIGLIYTMPGIFHSFQMLNQWAKKIQDLMNNACQSGQKIGQDIAKMMGMERGIGGAVDDVINKMPNPESIIKGVDSSMNSFFSGIGLAWDKAVGTTDKDEVTAPTEITELNPADIENILADMLSTVRVFNSITTSTLYSVMNGGKVQKLNEFFCKVVQTSTDSEACSKISDYHDDDDGASLASGSFFLTYKHDNEAIGVFSLPKFLKDEVGYDNDVILTKYLLLLKTAMQKSGLGDIVVGDDARIDDMLIQMKKIVKAKQNKLNGVNSATEGFAGTGTTTAEQEHEAAKKEAKGITAGNSKVATVTAEKVNIDVAQIGIGIAKLLIGDDADGIRSMANLKKSVQPIGVTVTVWPDGDESHDSVGVSLLARSGSFSRSNAGGVSFFEGVSLPTKSLFKVSLQIAWRLIDRDVSEMTADIIENESAGLGSAGGYTSSIPWIIPKFYIYAKVAQQSLPGDKEIAITKLAQYNTCSIAMTALQIFKRPTMPGQGKMAYAFSFNGSNTQIKLSKFGAASSEVREKMFSDFLSKDRTKKWSKFTKGFKGELLKIIQKESFVEDSPDKSLEAVCNTERLDAYFRTLNYDNRRRAASQVDQAN